MGRHDAPHGQPGQLPGGITLAARPGDTPGRHRADQADPEPAAETDAEHTEGWRH